MMTKNWAVVVLVSTSFGCSTISPPSAKVLVSEPQNNSIHEYGYYRDIQTRGQDQDPPAQDPNAIVVLAISGGGLRAANFAVGAMLAMEDTKFGQTKLLRQVDYFTTVSGGGLAAASYLSGMLERDCETRHSFDYLSYLDDNSNVLEDLRAGFLADGNALRLLSPSVILTKLDRGDILQSSLAKRFLTHSSNISDCTKVAGESKEVLLGHVFVPESAERTVLPTTPYLITNATNYTSGAIVPFTPYHLEETEISCYTHHMEKHPIGPGYYFQMPLAAGLRASANFPVGLATATFDIEDIDEAGSREYCKSIMSKKSNWEHLQLTDGGQADNLGINSALRILNFEYQKSAEKSQTRLANREADSEAMGKKPDSRDPKFLLLIIDAFNGAKETTSEKESSPNPIAAFFKSTDLPLASFRNVASASLSAKDSRKYSFIDAISLRSDVNVAYINMESLPEELISVGTIASTAIGLSKKQQGRLIAAGAYQTYLSFGVEDSWNRALRLLDKILPKASLDDLRSFEADMPESKASIAQFSKFRRLGQRNELIRNGISALSKTRQELANFIAETNGYLVTEEMRRVEESLKKYENEHRPQNESAKAVQLGNITRTLLQEMRKSVERGRLTVSKMKNDLVNRKGEHLADQTRSTLRELVDQMAAKVEQFSETFTKLQGVSLDRINEDDYASLTKLAKSIDYLNKQLEQRYIDFGIKAEWFFLKGDAYVGNNPNAEEAVSNFQLSIEKAIKIKLEQHRESTAAYLAELTEFEKSVRQEAARLDSELEAFLDEIETNPATDQPRSLLSRLTRIETEKRDWLFEPTTYSKLKCECRTLQTWIAGDDSEHSFSSVADDLPAECSREPLWVGENISLVCSEPDRKVACEAVRRSRNAFLQQFESTIGLLDEQLHVWPDLFARSTVKMDYVADENQGTIESVCLRNKG